MPLRRQPDVRLGGIFATAGMVMSALGDQCPELLHNGVVMVGYSLGANTMIKFLATLNSDGPVRAAAAISTPLDLAASADRMAQTPNRIYHNYLLARMKVFYSRCWLYFIIPWERDFGFKWSALEFS